MALGAASLLSIHPVAQGGGRPPDITGNWRLDNAEDPGQPPLADYTGIPFNAAGRLRADTTPESIWDTPEYQCRPHSLPHQWRGVGGARILAEQDPLTREVRAYHLQYMRSLNRPIFVDGRPHPPAYAPHSWTGFSTGEWIGQTLKVTTTHVKDGYLKRGGPQTSDVYTFTEYITRHDDTLTVVQVVDDPIYLDEPYVLSITSTYDPLGGPSMETCSGSSLQNGGADRHHVPHFLPGQNGAIGEFLKEDDWLPLEPTRGGVKTLYPEYRAAISGLTVDAAKVDAITIPSSRSANDVAKRIADQSPKDGQVHVLPVQGNIYMLVADGTNIAASIGRDGIAVVNTGSAQMSDKILATLTQLAETVAARTAPNNCFGPYCPGITGWSSPYFNTVIASPAPPKSMRYVINTSAAPEHVGGNAKLAAAGTVVRGGGSGFGGAINEPGRKATIVSHVGVLDRLDNSANNPPTPEEALPTDTYLDDFYKLSEYVNGEAVILYRAPAANTDGDSIVFFRHSEVIAAGNIYSTISYPMIEIDKGGSIQGVIDGLNHILDLAVAEYRSQGGTWVIPGRGRLSDTGDVGSYRNMLVIIRDRIADLKKKGMTLEQVKAARPTMDFDGRYSTAAAGTWTTDKFVEAVYKSLQEKK